MLLQEITPNVGRWPDTAPDPLGAYLRTLGEIDRLAPHAGLPRARAGDRRRHPARPPRSASTTPSGWTRTSPRCATGASSAYDVARVVWADDGLGFHEQRFALVEALSHLERLEAEGRAEQVEPNRWAARTPATNGV